MNVTPSQLTRRSFLITGSALLSVRAVPTLAQTPAQAIHVLKDPSCGCCTTWAEILVSEGFAVTTEDSSGADLFAFKLDHGIPQAMVSCHTGEIEGYMIEGHVPPADIRRLLAQRLDAIGLAVPGMPYGSPGMGPENDRQAYEVFLIGRDGSTAVFSRYAAS